MDRSQSRDSNTSSSTERSSESRTSTSNSATRSRTESSKSSETQSRTQDSSTSESSSSPTRTSSRTRDGDGDRTSSSMDTSSDNSRTRSSESSPSSTRRGDSSSDNNNRTSSRASSSDRPTSSEDRQSETSTRGGGGPTSSSSRNDNQSSSSTTQDSRSSSSSSSSSDSNSSSSSDSNSSSSSDSNSSSSSDSNSSSSSSSGPTSSSNTNAGPTSSSRSDSSSSSNTNNSDTSSSSNSESGSNSNSNSDSNSNSNSSSDRSSSGRGGGGGGRTRSKDDHNSSAPSSSYSYSTSTDVRTDVTEINGMPHTSTYTVLSTNTFTPALNNGNAKTSGFFNDSGAVGGTFAAVGIVVVALILALAWLLYRRRKAKRMDAEVMAAASAAAATTRTPFDDDDHDYVNDNDVVANGHNVEYDAASPMMREYYESPYENDQYPTGHYPGPSGYTGVASTDPYAHDSDAHNAAAGYLATARGTQPEAFYDAQPGDLAVHSQSLVSQPQYLPQRQPVEPVAAAPGAIFAIPQYSATENNAPNRQPSNSSATAPSSQPHEYVTVNEHMPPEQQGQIIETGSIPPQMPVFNGQQFTLASGNAGALAPVAGAGKSTARDPGMRDSGEVSTTTHHAIAVSDSARTSANVPEYEPQQPRLGLSSAARTAAAGPEKVPLEATPAAVAAPPLVPSSMPYLVGNENNANPRGSTINATGDTERHSSIIQPFEQSNSDSADGPEQHSGDGDWDPPALSTAWFPQSTTGHGDLGTQQETGALDGARLSAGRVNGARLSDQRPYPDVLDTSYGADETVSDAFESVSNAVHRRDQA